MPFYDFKCEKCGKIFDELLPMSKSSQPQKCECGGTAVKIYTNSRIDATMVDNERWSWALGVNEDQIPEFQQKFPDWKFDSQGRVLVKNRQDKLKKLKQRGFVELD